VFIRIIKRYNEVGEIPLWVKKKIGTAPPTWNTN
jgi:hypothetical protein